MDISSFLIVFKKSQNRKSIKGFDTDPLRSVIINKAVPHNKICAKCLFEDSQLHNQGVNPSDSRISISDDDDYSDIVELLRVNDSVGNIIIFKVSDNVKLSKTEDGIKFNEFKISKLSAITKENLDELKLLVYHYQQKMESEIDYQLNESFHSSKISLTHVDTQNDALLQRFRKIVLDNVSDSSFGNFDLAKKVNMSKSQLFRKIKSKTGKSTAIYIRCIRLQKAKEYLRNSELTISEIAYETGFNCPSYFSRTFSKYFGFPPSRQR
jgi:AraC-like DNA-binding protein